MKYVGLLIGAGAFMLLLLSLPVVHSMGAHTALQDTMTPTAFSYLPFVAKNWAPMPTETPAPPSEPVLHPIENTDGDHCYVVSWDSVPGATAYWLDVDDDPQFGSPDVAYIGPDSAKQFAYQRRGTHYYRVRAKDEMGSSNWSNTTSATVMVDPPHYLIGEILWGLYTCDWNLGVYDETGPWISTTYYWLRENDWGLWVHHWDVDVTWSSSGNTYRGTVECWLNDVSGVGSYYTGMFEFTGGYFSTEAAQASDTDYP